MPLYDGTRHFKIEIIQAAHYLEIEARLIADEWSGVARDYATYETLDAFILELECFDATLAGEALFECHMIRLRFYVLDPAGHVGCFVRLMSPVFWSHDRSEEYNQLAIELRTEASFVGPFLRCLKRMRRDGVGEATLVTE